MRTSKGTGNGGHDRAVFLALVLFCLSGVTTSAVNVKAQAAASWSPSGGSVSYSWTYATPDTYSVQLQMTIEISPPLRFLQWEYSKRDHRYRNPARVGSFIFNDPHNYIIAEAARAVRNLASERGFNEVDVALSFVQSLPYETIEEVNFQEFAVEVLLNGKGDCSDKSVLFAGLLIAMGYDCVIFDLPGHMSVGIWCNPYYSSSCHFWYQGKCYCFCETTTPGWRVGECNQDYQVSKPKVVRPVALKKWVAPRMYMQ
jgi:hypothetical protein